MPQMYVHYLLDAQTRRSPRQWHNLSMAGLDDSRFEAAMKRLNAAETAKREAVRELMEIGAIRSWGLVADLGEAIAARYYGVDLAPPSTAGYAVMPGRSR